jgi:hypothetical protein
MTSSPTWAPPWTRPSRDRHIAAVIGTPGPVAGIRDDLGTSRVWVWPWT